MKPIYFAAPLFSDAEREYNIRVVAEIEQFYPVFLPQRDGRLISDLLRRGISIRSAFDQICQADLQAIKDCAIVVGVLDGSEINDGVAFELGYAFAMGRRCVALQTDFRRSIFGRNNPMLEHCLIAAVSNSAALVEVLKRELSST